MLGITDWFKRLGDRDDAQAVESAEEKARHEGVPAQICPPTRAASSRIWTKPSTRFSA